MNERPGFFTTLARMWFPISLVVCFLIMLPSVILFFMNLIGYETEVNQRLEENLRLSYHLPIPWWGAFLLFLVPVFLLLLYFLKLKRKPLQVPSTFLWKKSIEDLHVNSLFQWLRNNVLLILQLLVLMALIYAILAPRLHGTGGAGRFYILMIDNSASMSATDAEGGSRLEWAKKEALKEIDSMSDNDQAMLIVFNSRVDIVTPYSSNREIIRNRIREIEPTQRPTHIEEALSLADGRANQTVAAEKKEYDPNESPEDVKKRLKAQGLRAEIHLYSDGRFADAPDFALGNLDIHYHAAGRIGEKANNVGIVVLSARRAESPPNTLEVLVQLNNYGAESATVRLDVGVKIDGEPGGRVDGPVREPITIPPMSPRQTATEGAEKAEQPGQKTVAFEVRNVDYQREAEIHVQLAGHSDLLAVDDQAWLVLNVVRKARVLVIGPPNEILRAFFDDESTREIADVTWMSGGDFADAAQRKQQYLDPAKNGDYDLIVFDRVAPKTEDEMPKANTVFIGIVPPTVKADTSKQIEKLFVKSGDTRFPIMRFLDRTLPEIGIGSAIRINAGDLPERTPRLMEAEGNIVLMFSLAREAHTDVVQTFALVGAEDKWNTNWPLKPAFPIFWRNVLYHLGHVSDDSTESALQPGSVRQIRPPNNIEKIVVRDPQGKPNPLERAPKRTDFDFLQTDSVGIYRAEWTDGSRSFAVNLLDSSESNVEPRDSIRIGSSTVAAFQNQSRSKDLWKWAVVVGLFFLLLEWYVYNRRVYV